MIILTIRTDKPEAEVGLYDDTQQLAYETWHAHRALGTTIHQKIHALLHDAGKGWSDVQGLVAFRGPGSFTGLRIGLTVADTIAYAQQCPIVGAVGEQWREQGIERLLAGESDKMVMPEYGAEAHITLPRK